MCGCRKGLVVQASSVALEPAAQPAPPPPPPDPKPARELATSSR